MLLEFSLYQMDTFQNALKFYENDCNSYNSSLHSIVFFSLKRMPEKY